MPEMIQVNELVTFECPSCGYITKGKRGDKINCPKCTPDHPGYILDRWQVENRAMGLSDNACYKALHGKTCRAFFIETLKA